MHICLSESWGGLEMYPGRVTPEFQRQGWEVHGVALAGSRVAQSFSAAGVDPLVFRSRLAALLNIHKLLRYLRKHDIRVVHAHKSSDMRVGALLVAIRPSLRLFFTDHMGVRKPKKDLYHRWAYSKLTRLFSISKATRCRNLKAFPLPQERIEQLYYGIDLSRYACSVSEGDRRLLRSSLGIPPKTVAIALPGRISRSKGHSVWIEALRYLRQYHPDIAFIGLIIGEADPIDSVPGGYLSELKDIIDQYELQPYVQFCGFRDDLHMCLMAVDMVCIPSADEAFGLSVIEAMAAGTPVIGSDSGAIPELLSEGRGLLASPKDPTAWASSLLQLIEDQEKNSTMVERALIWVESNFGIDQHVSKLVNYYSRCGIRS